MGRPVRNIPEIIQTSAMDCGPAVLSSVLNGFGIQAGYDRLRAACQTDLDGTSINILEDILNGFQLQADQVMLPDDHLFSKTMETLPAIFVVRLPSGLTHFVAVWRKLWGNRLQIMDPATGRRTQSIESFKQDLFQHRFEVPAAGWREFAGSNEFLPTLIERTAALGISRSDLDTLVQAAKSDESWAGLATLDAAVRFVQSLKSSGGVKQVDRPLLERLIRQSNPVDHEQPLIPWSYWSVEPAEPDEEGAPQLTLKGAVLIKVKQQSDRESADSKLPPAYSDLIAPRPIRPEQYLWRLIYQDGLLTPLLILFLLLFSALITFTEAIFWRGILDFSSWGLTTNQQTSLFVGFLALLALNFALKATNQGVVLGLARRVEVQLRAAILQKLPQIQARYFRSRPVSDMAERNHNLHRVREIPLNGSRFIELNFLVIFTTIGLAIMIPSMAGLALLHGSIALVLPYLVQSFLQERDLQVRTHVGALTQYYLDALRGVVPTRAHGAEQSILREHENLLVQWGYARYLFLERLIGLESIQYLLGTLFGIIYIFVYRISDLPLPGLLLAAYWLLNIVEYGREMTFLARNYPTARNHLLRANELIQTTVEAIDPPDFQPPQEAQTPLDTVSICFKQASVRVGGHVALNDLNVELPPGRHVAIVGPSGAGKSTFIATLLGMHFPFEGEVSVNGNPINDWLIQQLRRKTIWIDPAVHLWNQSLWENISFGLDRQDTVQPAQIIQQAELINFLERLPDGWSTKLGEDGRLISGGEGQRVRLGRGLSRPNPSLILMDEPFRGLARQQRQRLLHTARSLWQDSTLLCVTHDLEEAATFDHVLFFFGGRCIQQGPPHELKGIEKGPFAYYFKQNQTLTEDTWSAEHWKRWHLHQGRLKHG